MAKAKKHKRTEERIQEGAGKENEAAGALWTRDDNQYSPGCHR